MERKRNYGIDFLRIVLMFMICTQHVLGYGNILKSFQIGSFEHAIYSLINIACLCAVNGFAIISGYMATDRTQKYNKIIEMWFQVIFYSFILTMVFNVVGISSGYGIKEIIKSLMPITFGKFWYFSAYFGLFFAMPVLNKFLFLLDEQKAKLCFIITIVLFTVIGIPADAFKTNWGYSAVWLMILYCIGAFAKIGRIFEAKKTITLSILLLLSVFTAWGFSIFLNINIFLDYISPLMLLNGLLMVIIFSRIKIKGIIIAKISPLVFGVYLFHENECIRDIIRKSFMHIPEMNVCDGLLFVLFSILLIFILGLFIEFIRSKIANAIKIYVLSEKIVVLANKLLNKLCIVLK